MTGITYCALCEWVDPPSRKLPPHRWLCVRHKQVEGMGFVVPGQWVNTEPYLRCRDVNGGICLLYEPIRQKETDNVPPEAL
jgi:hypothetical protein